jgi:hypothetical protein
MTDYSPLFHPEMVLFTPTRFHPIHFPRPTPTRRRVINIEEDTQLHTMYAEVRGTNKSPRDRIRHFHTVSGTHSLINSYTRIRG